MLSGAAEKHSPCQTHKATYHSVTSAQHLDQGALPPIVFLDPVSEEDRLDEREVGVVFGKNLKITV